MLPGPRHLKQRWRNWVDKRSPRQDQLTLTQRNVYIVPSKGGWIYACVVLILLLAAINEQLNLAYALAFLLGGVGLSGMWLTHMNLRDVRLSLGVVPSVHAGQMLNAPVLLDTPVSHVPGLTQGFTTRRRRSQFRGRYGLLLDGHVPCEIAIGQTCTVRLAVATTHRGAMLLPRWRIETTYPLGLFRAWSYWRAATPCLVWPALEDHAPEPAPSSLADAGATAPQHPSAHEVAEEVREWRRGDALRSVIWKKSATRMAAGQDPLSRYSTAQPQTPQWIDWGNTAGLHTEARLSRLATWLVRAERRATTSGQPYGLRLPEQSVAPAQGQAHLKQCLDMLARWGAP